MALNGVPWPSMLFQSPPCPSMVFNGPQYYFNSLKGPQCCFTALNAVSCPSLVFCDPSFSWVICGKSPFVPSWLTLLLLRHLNCGTIYRPRLWSRHCHCLHLDNSRHFPLPLVEGVQNYFITWVSWPSIVVNGPSYLLRLQWYSMALIGIPWPSMALNSVL